MGVVVIVPIKEVSLGEYTKCVPLFFAPVQSILFLITAFLSYIFIIQLLLVLGLCHNFNGTIHVYPV